MVAVMVPYVAPAAMSGSADATIATIVSDTLVVRARGLAERTLPTAVSVMTVIDLEEEPAGSDLAELLARVAGLQVRRYGGLGAQAVPSVRGSSGAQVQVLVDGLPLVDAQRGAIDIAMLPIERYESVEVHRGLVPVAFGGIGAAGAINLRTRRAARGIGHRFFTGSYGDVGGRVHMGLASDDDTRRGLIVLHGRSIDNDYVYQPRIPAAQVDLYPDTTWTRENAGFNEYGWFAHGEIEGRRGLLRIAGGGFRRDGGRPGPFNWPSPHARSRQERLDVRLGVATVDRELTADLLVARRDEQLHDDLQEVGGDPPGTTAATNEDLVARVVWSPEWSWGRPEQGPAVDLGLTAGTDGRLQWYRQSISGDEQPRRNRRTVSTFAAANLWFHGPRIGITPSWRWQRQHDDFPPVPSLPWLPEEDGVVHQTDAVSPAMAVAWQAVSNRLLVTAHWHETVRQPTWVELFGQPGGLHGSRELVAEDIRGRDLGVRIMAAELGAVLRLTWFEQATDNAIVWDTKSFGFAEPLNAERTRTEGIEVEGVLDRGPVVASLAVTHQDARDRSVVDPTYNSKHLPYLSDWDGFADLQLRVGNWRPSVSLAARSRAYTDRYNTEDGEVAGHVLWSLALARTWYGETDRSGRRVTATVRVVNLTDRRVQDVEGYPLPGRSVRFALQWQ